LKRGDELEILTSEEMKNWISDHHISLVSYDELFNVFSVTGRYQFSSYINPHLDAKHK